MSVVLLMNSGVPHLCTKNPVFFTSYNNYHHCFPNQNSWFARFQKPPRREPKLRILAWWPLEPLSRTGPETVVVVNDSKHIFGICLGCLNVFDLRLTGLFTYIYIHIYVYMPQRLVVGGGWGGEGGGGLTAIPYGGRGGVNTRHGQCIDIYIYNNMYIIYIYICICSI